MEFNYLVHDPAADRVRYGWAQNERRLKSRLADNRNMGFIDILMLRPATFTEEQTQHQAFRDRGWLIGHDTSTYQAADDIFEWATALLLKNYAVSDLSEVKRIPPLPFEVWRFGANLPYQDLNGQMSLIEGVPVKERPEFISSFPTLNSLGDEWFTPDDILERARQVLGRFDTDPASCYEANLRVKAVVWYGKDQNGLSAAHPWAGRVWLNPPYGRGDNSAAAFIRRLVEEYQAGRTVAAITCLNLNSMSSLWFSPLDQIAAAHAIWRGRPNFIPPANKEGGSPTKGTVLSYLGGDVETFAVIFSPVAMVMTPFSK